MIKKGLAVAVILLFIGMCIVPSTAVQGLKEKPSPISFDGDTLYVGGSGPNNYTTIQSAINDAVDGDTVFVYDDSSPYVEEIRLEKSVSLMGEDKNTTVITPSNWSVNIDGADDLFICGFTIMTDCYGFEFTNVNNISIYNNIIKPLTDYFYNGIWFEKSNDILIFENSILNSEGGINDEQRALYIKDCNRIIISNNTIIEMYERNFQAIDLFGCNDNVIINNKISGYNYGIAISGNDNIIANNEITDCGYGISLGPSSNTKIENNKISNCNWEGITISNSLNNQISNNTISDSENGIFVKSFSWNNKIIYNNLININERLGFFRFFSFMNTWDGNYWDGPQESPYEIKGRFGLFIPWSNYDNNPASEPYDIGV